MKKITLTKSEDWFNIPFDRERPFMKIYQVELTGEFIDNDFTTFQFRYRITKPDSRVESDFIQVKNKEYKRVILSDFEKDFEHALSFDIQYITSNPKLKEAIIEVRYHDIKVLTIENPKIEFEKHLNNLQNTRILFSGPFGQGKTTFLNMYFDEISDKYEVFRVFPVNYSVASNEDIFRYIKADLLYQLTVDKKIEFGLIEASYAETIPAFMKKNIHEVLAPFLLLVPLVGKNMFEIFEKFNGISQKFFELHDGEKVDEADEANKFWQSIFNTEGNLYEDNFITQLIRQQIAKIKTDKKKETVLIIDDLDRVDPEHTFRILNIISAHYDTYLGKPIEEANKFGFDKVIIVCDHENIRHTFEHRFGPKVNFSGYINKFFSSAPFYYDNKKMMQAKILNLTQNLRNSRDGKEWSVMIQLILGPLIKADQIALRDILRFSRSQLNQIASDLDRNNEASNFYFNKAYFTPIIILLCQQFNQEMLISKFETCKKKRISLNQVMIDPYARLLLVGLVRIENSSSATQIYNFNDYSFTLKIAGHKDLSYTTLTEITALTHKGLNISPSTFQFKLGDFYDLLIRNIEYYFEIRD